MTTSVVIPTYNGAHKIIHVLRAIEQQELQPDETIVVVDGSTDNTVEVITAADLKLSNLRVINQANQGRSGVRNSGAKAATNDLLVFLDDDIQPEKNWLQLHVNHHEQNKNSFLTAAAIDVPVNNGTDYQKFKANISAQWAEELKQYNVHPIPKEKVFLTAANFSVPRLLFLQLGGFDSILNDGEDFDLVTRATMAGISIFYNSDACVWHLEKNSCLGNIKRTRGYYEAGRILLKAKPEIYEPIFGHRRQMNKGWKAQLFRFFCSMFWIESIDKDWWKWLPEQLRFKLYDVVLTANGIFFPEIVKL